MTSGASTLEGLQWEAGGTACAASVGVGVGGVMSAPAPITGVSV